MSMTHDEMIAVIAHHRDGGKVEYMGRGDKTWTRVYNDNPCWNFASHDYRIKPEPLVLWLVMYENGSRHSIFDAESHAIDMQKLIANSTIKKFIEQP